VPLRHFVTLRDDFDLQCYDDVSGNGRVFALIAAADAAEGGE
jgi:hypothetical protein